MGENLDPLPSPTHHYCPTQIRCLQIHCLLCTPDSRTSSPASEKKKSKKKKKKSALFIFSTRGRHLSSLLQSAVHPCRLRPLSSSPASRPLPPPPDPSSASTARPASTLQQPDSSAACVHILLQTADAATYSVCVQIPTRNPRCCRSPRRSPTPLLLRSPASTAVPLFRRPRSPASVASAASIASTAVPLFRTPQLPDPAISHLIPTPLPPLPVPPSPDSASASVAVAAACAASRRILSTAVSAAATVPPSPPPPEN